jgi:hypothetical protein
MMFYKCSYGEYVHEIWAESEDEAAYIASKLQMGVEERYRDIPTEYRPSKLAVLKGGLSRWDVIHAVCFMSFLANRQGLIEPRGGPYGDETTLHALIHFNAFGSQDPAKFKRYIASGIKFFEDNVLGLPPPSMVLGHLPPRHTTTLDFKDPFDVASWAAPREGHTWHVIVPVTPPQLDPKQPG